MRLFPILLDDFIIWNVGEVVFGESLILMLIMQSNRNSILTKIFLEAQNRNHLPGNCNNLLINRNSLLKICNFLFIPEASASGIFMETLKKMLLKEQERTAPD